MDSDTTVSASPPAMTHEKINTVSLKETKGQMQLLQ